MLAELALLLVAKIRFHQKKPQWGKKHHAIVCPASTKKNPCGEKSTCMYKTKPRQMYVPCVCCCAQSKNAGSCWVAAALRAAAHASRLPSAATWRGMQTSSMTASKLALRSCDFLTMSTRTGEASERSLV